MTTHRRPRIRVSGMTWNSSDRLLLISQGRPESPRWMLPGGGVEGGEALMEALSREISEETGMNEHRINDPVAMIESIAPEGSGSSRHLLHVVFHVTVDELVAEQAAAKDKDVHDLKWFARNELLGVPIHPPIGAWLSAWRPGAPFAFFGPLWAP